VLHAAVYPVSLLVTLVAIPLPWLVNALLLVGSVLSTILYPVTWTARLLARTFILAPVHVVLAFLHTLYPVYVFVGGVVGVGAVLGVAFGWAARLLTWLLLDRRASASSATAAQPLRKRRRRSRTKRYSFPQADHTAARVERLERAAERAERAERSERDVVSPLPQHQYEYERRYVPITDFTDYVQISDGMLAALDASRSATSPGPGPASATATRGAGNAREAVVLGLRRRGLRL
jgi:hypothetical protein